MRGGLRGRGWAAGLKAFVLEASATASQLRPRLEL